MEHLSTHVCTICGEEGPEPSRWFLVIESQWEDKVKILEWNDFLAMQEGMHSACSPAHVQELVIHWMTTGSLSYPFASTGPGDRTPRHWQHALRRNINTRSARPIGELAVHRESMKRVLKESPHSLQTILDALLGALQRNTPRANTEIHARLVGSAAR